jgi:hypothetical protein
MAQHPDCGGERRRFSICEVYDHPDAGGVPLGDGPGAYGEGPGAGGIGGDGEGRGGAGEGDVQYMNLDPKRFCISHCLEKHPLLLEKKVYRFKYLNVLAYFIDKYAAKDKITKAMFENYKNTFIKAGEIYTKKRGKEVIADIKSIIRCRLKWFKTFSFRYILLCDIFTLIYPASEEKAVKIIEEIQAYLRKKSRRNISALSEVLLTDKKIEKKFCLAEYHMDCWRKNKSFLHLPLRKIMVSSNMSSGKSTLINALAGKRINRSMNEACTSKLHYIYPESVQKNPQKM